MARLGHGSDTAKKCCQITWRGDQGLGQLLRRSCVRLGAATYARLRLAFRPDVSQMFRNPSSKLRGQGDRDTFSSIGTLRVNLARSSAAKGRALLRTEDLLHGSGRVLQADMAGP